MHKYLRTRANDNGKCHCHLRPASDRPSDVQTNASVASSPSLIRRSSFQASPTCVAQPKAPTLFIRSDAIDRLRWRLSQPLRDLSSAHSDIALGARSRPTDFAPRAAEPVLHRPIDQPTDRPTDRMIHRLLSNAAHRYRARHWWWQSRSNPSANYSTNAPKVSSSHNWQTLSAQQALENHTLVAHGFHRRVATIDTLHWVDLLRHAPVGALALSSSERGAYLWSQASARLVQRVA